MSKFLDLKSDSYQNVREILEVTVQSTRKTFKCDRVIIYDVSQLPKAKVIAESVAPEYESILGKTIEDPFLSGEYLELYCYGRAIAVENIESANIANDRLETLKKLKITGLAIAPIVMDNELVALLVAHKSSSKPWHPQTSDLLTQQANRTSYVLASILQKDFQKVQANGNNPIPTMELFNNGSRGIVPGEEQSQVLEQTELKEITDKIAAEVGRENLLDRAVTEVRHLLKCDRVVVYSLDENNYGVIVAEAVAGSWTSSWGNTIDDPCMAVRYIEEYRNGRVRAIDDISSNKVTPCYREQLERLEVKANLVAPIVGNSKLFGLLIAHQCDAPREWQKPEIDWITEIAKQVGLMLENSEIVTETESEEAKLAGNGDAKWDEHFTDTIQYIRQSLTKEDILKASVKEVRRVLNCDRVVVYSLDRDFRYSEVVAESVAPGWTRAINKTIDDPCFEPTYRQKYLNGRVRAWNDIYESSMTDCYIRQLEALEVKANLVAPIINDGSLFGLLVAHQCSDFRNWQQPEIRWTAQIATQIGFALESAKFLAETKQLQHQLENEAKLTQYYTDAVRYIRESLHREDILEISVEEIRRVLDCDRVVIYSLDRNFRYSEVIAESVAPGWTRVINKAIDDPCFEPTYRQKYLNGRVRAWSNIYESGMTGCYIRQLEALEVKANLVTPIISEGQLFGLLVAHQCSDFRNWQQSEIRWTTQIATQIGFALDNAKLLKQLQESSQSSALVFNRQQEHTETLKHQVVNILADNGDAYETLSREAMRQSETTIEVLHQIQNVADAFDSIALSVQQVKLQQQQQNATVQDTKENLERNIASILNIQHTMQNIAIGSDRFGHSSQQLLETVQQVRDLSKQLVQQSMNLTREVNRSQIDSSDRDSVIDLSDAIFSLMQQLFEASTRVEPLFANIQTEAREKNLALDGGMQQLINSVEQFQTICQKLDRVVTLNQKINTPIENISRAVDNQTQSSIFAKNSVRQVASIAERISEQSTTITQSFDRLVVLIQKL